MRLSPEGTCTFYIVRHGQCQANAEGRFAGENESPLTELGKQQALDAAKVIAKLEEKPQTIVHSPLSRARDTAYAIAEALEIEKDGEHCIVEKGIREKHWGKLAGELGAEYDAIARANPPGGETFKKFFARSNPAICTQLQAHNEKGPVVFVAHGGTLLGVADMLGMVFPEDTAKNGGVYKFEVTLVPDKTRRGQKLACKVTELSVEQDTFIETPIPLTPKTASRHL